MSEANRGVEVEMTRSAEISAAHRSQLEALVPSDLRDIASLVVDVAADLSDSSDQAEVVEAMELSATYWRRRFESYMAMGQLATLPTSLPALLVEAERTRTARS